MWKITAYENTWTGLRRKRRERQRMNKTESVANDVTQESAMDTSSNSENCVDDSLVTESLIDDNQMNIDDAPIERNSAIKRSLDEDETYFVKKLKIEDENTPTPIVEVLLSLHSGKNNIVDLQTTYISGMKEEPQRLMQCLKNNLI